MLQLVTINIGAAGQARAERIADWLDDRDDDVIILTETSNGPGTAWLLDRFRTAGWRVIHTPSPDGDRSAAIVTRIAGRAPHIRLDLKVPLPHRLPTCWLDTTPAIPVVGAYVPSRDRSATKVDKKKGFIEDLVAAVATTPEFVRGGMILGGDLNVIDRFHQPAHTGFLDFELDMAKRLTENGLLDAFTHCQPGVQEHSWVGRTGDGYRYDYLYVGAPLTRVLASCNYIHNTRPGLTDHSAVHMRLNIRVLERLPITEPAASTLF